MIWGGRENIGNNFFFLGKAFLNFFPWRGFLKFILVRQLKSYDHLKFWLELWTLQVVRGDKSVLKVSMAITCILL